MILTSPSKGRFRWRKQAKTPSWPEIEPFLWPLTTFNQSVHENGCFCGQIVISRSCFQPLVAGDAVEWDEGEEDRGLMDVVLEVGIGSVGGSLTDFETTGSAEHHVYDSEIADAGDYPLP